MENDEWITSISDGSSMRATSQTRKPSTSTSQDGDVSICHMTSKLNSLGWHLRRMRKRTTPTWQPILRADSQAVDSRKWEKDGTDIISPHPSKRKTLGCLSISEVSCMWVMSISMERKLEAQIMVTWVLKSMSQNASNGGRTMSSQ